MVKTQIILLFLLGIVMSACCKTDSYLPLLQEARRQLTQHPDSALSLLQQVDESCLLCDDWFEYALLSTQSALAADSLPNAKLMHKAAQRMSLMHDADREMLATYYYYSALAYEANADASHAAEDCLKGISYLDVKQESDIKDDLLRQLRTIAGTQSDEAWMNMNQQIAMKSTPYKDPNTFLLVFVVMFVIILIVVSRSVRDVHDVQRLRQELQQLQSLQFADNSGNRLNPQSLSLHCQLFQKSEVYAEMQCLRYMRDQMVSNHNRVRFMQAVEEHFKNDISALQSICPELTQEDIFYCMMSMMHFPTHEVALCLGVTDEAVRKRKSRIRQKLDVESFHLFF